MSNISILPKELRLLEQTRQLLAEASSIDEIKEIRDKAEALRMYCQQANESLDLQNAYAELKARAERKAGRLLTSTKKKANRHSSDCSLQELGIEATQSHRWQRIASIPDADFERHISETKEQAKELTTASLLRLASPPKKDPNPWTLSEALEHLADAIEKISAKWPEEHANMLPLQLEALAERYSTEVVHGDG